MWSIGQHMCCRGVDWRRGTFSAKNQRSGACRVKKGDRGTTTTYYQMFRSTNVLVMLLRQLLRAHRKHCLRNLGLSSRVVSTSHSG